PENIGSNLPGEEHIGPAHNCNKRRPKLMGDDGQEFILGSVGFFRFLKKFNVSDGYRGAVGQLIGKSKIGWDISPKRMPVQRENGDDSVASSYRNKQTRSETVSFDEVIVVGGELKPAAVSEVFDQYRSAPLKRVEQGVLYRMREDHMLHRSGQAGSMAGKR